MGSDQSEFFHELDFLALLNGAPLDEPYYRLDEKQLFSSTNEPGAR